MTTPVGGPLRNLDFENILKPYTDKKSVPSLFEDREKVRVPDGDSVDVDGRRVDAKQTAVNNLRHISQTLGQMVTLPSTRAALTDSVRHGASVPRLFFNTVEGIAIDAFKMASGAINIAKDTVEATGWGARGAIEHVLGKDKPAPMPKPATNPPEFDKVNLASKETGRSGYFQYALKDGKIWTKYDPVMPEGSFEFKVGEKISSSQARNMLEEASGPFDYEYNAEKGSFTCTPKADADTVGYKMVAGRLEPCDIKEASAWHLHDGMGGPNLPEGENIVEMQVAGDFIIAVSDNGSVYRYDPTKPDAAWKQDAGCPFHTKVKMPENARDWTLGNAVTAKPKRNCFKSMNPYTDIVGYFEDAQGMKGDFNFVATTGMLTENGREIRYRDTGLAADFTRGFLTPHKGMFEADKVASAGSTWMVVGTEPDGTPAIYTRMFDYEINGACPGQRYTYDEDAPFDKDKNYSFSDYVAHMPLPTWQKADFPKLEGQAQITDHIDIITTGQGNDAREMRIEGRDANGVTGYYSKGLADKDWTFTATGEELTGKVITPGVADPSRVHTEPVARDYSQASWGAELKDAPLQNIELLDFHEYQTPDQPSVLRFTLESGKTLDIPLHTTDGYTFYNAKPEDAAKMGQGGGVPKVVTGSIVIPDSVKNSDDPEVKAFAEKYLAPFDSKENSLMLAADCDGVRMTSGGYHRNSDKGFDYEKYPQYDISFKRDSKGETYYEKKTDNPKLDPRPSMTREELEDVIARNEALKKDMSNELKQTKRSHKMQWGRALASEAAIKGLCFGISIFNFSQSIKHAAPVSQLMPPLMDAHEKAQFSAAFKTPEGYERAQAKLDENIAKAQSMLKG